MGCASFLFTDFESSYGTETIRVRIAGWSSARPSCQRRGNATRKRQRQLL